MRVAEIIEEKELSQPLNDMLTHVISCGIVKRHIVSMLQMPFTLKDKIRRGILAMRTFLIGFQSLLSHSLMVKR